MEEVIQSCTILGLNPYTLESGSHKLSSLRGIARIPVNRSRDDHMNVGDTSIDIGNMSMEFGQNHPYACTKSDSGLKPYVSQPVPGSEPGLGRTEEYNVAGRHSVDYIRDDDTSFSDSPTPVRLTALPTNQAISQPQTSKDRSIPFTFSRAMRQGVGQQGVVVAIQNAPASNGCVDSDSSAQTSQKISAQSKSISSALLNGTQTGFAILGFGLEVGGTNSAADRKHNERRVMSGPDREMASASKPAMIDKETRHPHHSPYNFRTLAAFPMPPESDPNHLMDSEINRPPISTEGAASTAVSESDVNVLERKFNFVVKPLPDKTPRTQNMSASDMSLVLDTNNDYLPHEPLIPIDPFPSRKSTTAGVPPPPKDPELPRLFIPQLDRSLSFRGLIDGTARLSPSIIIRPPPLPLTNLPVLLTPGGSRTVEVNSERRSRLMMTMPALPLQGHGRGTKGHEEVDDFEEEAEEEEEEEEEEDEDDLIERRTVLGIATNSSCEETPRSSIDSGISTEQDEDDDDIVELRSVPSSSSQTLSRTSSYRTARDDFSPTASEQSHHRGDLNLLPDKSVSKATHLQQVDMTGFGFDLPNSWGLNEDQERDQRGAASFKGKAKQEWDGIEDVLPTAKVLSRSRSLQGRGDHDAVSKEVLGSASTISSRQTIATADRVAANDYEVIGREIGNTADASRVSLMRGGSGIGYSHFKSDALPCRSSPSDSLGGGTPMTASTTVSRGSESAVTTPRPRDFNIVKSGRQTTTPLILSRVPKGAGNAVGGNVRRPEMYKRASKSLIDVHAIEKKEMVEKMVMDREQEEERGWRAAWSRANEIADKCGEENRLEGEPLKPIDRTKADRGWEGSAHPLRRRRSMPTTDPPSYSGLFAEHLPGLRFQPNIQPREDEGIEKLPPYTNDIVLKAVMSRKMEFSSPGVQAKDRKWRKVLCVLEGTAFKVYRCPAGVSGWWESKVGPTTDSGPSSGRANGNATGKDRHAEALAREIELARARKSGEVAQPVLQMSSSVDSTNQRLPQTKPQGQQQQSGASQGVTKSALTFAVQLLKPNSTKHARSNSEVVALPGSSQQQSRRASLNIPRSSSGRTTPTTASASHRGSGSRSPATHPTTPASSSVVSSSRPSTPALSVNHNNSRMASNPKGKGKRNLLEPDESDLIRVYTMQHAESGLGKDYIKRQHVIRVRLEGEQFLLQGKDVEGVIAWIEGLQAAANVALDLDERPMPAGPVVPRRRRRRRGPVVN